MPRHGISRLTKYSSRYPSLLASSTTELVLAEPMSHSVIIPRSPSECLSQASGNNERSHAYSGEDLFRPAYSDSCTRKASPAGIPTRGAVKTARLALSWLGGQVALAQRRHPEIDDGVGECRVTETAQDRFHAPGCSFRRRAAESLACASRSPVASTVRPIRPGSLLKMACVIFTPLRAIGRVRDRGARAPGR